MSYRSKEVTLGEIAVGALTVGAVVLAGALIFGDSDPDGIVHIGADGKEYALPEDARRAIYQNREDCLVDIREQMGKIKEETGEDVQETPEDLCEATDDYADHSGSTVVYTQPHGYYYGPIVSEKGKWDSGRVKTWETSIPQRTFAIPGRVVQKSIAEAPAGSKPGSKVVVRGGFGVASKGFGGGAAS